MKRITSDDPPKGGLFKAIAVADKRTRRATFWVGETLRQLSPYALGALAIFVDYPPSVSTQASRATVLDRSTTARAISDYGASENMKSRCQKNIARSKREHRQISLPN
jgi:hypothetical protein